jgi:tetratricopeptide (TPR) repeat protein
MLGIVEPPSEAAAWNERAMELARSSPDTQARRWVASLANNMGWAKQDAGEYEEALELFRLALDERRRQGRPRELRIARWSVARCLRSLGRVEEALAEQRSLATELDEAAETDGYVDEEIAECLLELGREDEARPFFARAYAELAGVDGLAADEQQRLERLRSLGAG